MDGGPRKPARCTEDPRPELTQRQELRSQPQMGTTGVVQRVGLLLPHSFLSLATGQELGGLGLGWSAFRVLPSHSGLRSCLCPRLRDGRSPQGLSGDDNPLYASKQLEENGSSNARWLRDR